MLLSNPRQDHWIIFFSKRTSAGNVILDMQQVYTAPRPPNKMELLNTRDYASVNFWMRSLRKLWKDILAVWFAKLLSIFPLIMSKVEFAATLFLMFANS